MVVEALELGGEQFAQAVHFREVSLTGLSESLAGVVAMAPEPVLIGSVGARAALRSALPEPVTTTDEVRAYVKALLETNRIDLPGASRRRTRTAIDTALSELPTHTIRRRGHKKELVRVRFVCPGHQRG